MSMTALRNPGAMTEMKQYCDEIGVTDRYTGFRHNLNRGTREPVQLGYTWLKNRPPPESPPQLFRSWAQRPSTTSRNDYLTTKPPRPMRGESADLLYTNEGHRHAERSIQERCGIDMSFPGRSEYMQRYHRSRQAPGPVTQPLNRGYTLNPSPDFAGVSRRPLAHHLPVRNATEYQYRHHYPDGNKIDKFPWLRK